MLSLVHLQRALVFTGATALAAACGEKFTPGAAGGAGGEAGAAGAASGGAHGGEPSVGGKGGAPPFGGAAGKSGAGGAADGGAADGGAADGGAGGEGGGPSEPPMIPNAGLQIWLRADQGVVHANGTVTAWRDASGNGRDALQTAVNQSPKLVDDALAGKAALVFDGTDDYLQFGPLDVDFSSGVSIFIALQQDETHTCDAYFEASTGEEKNDLHFGSWDASYNYEVLAETVHDTNYQVLVQAPQIAVAIQDAEGRVHVRSNSNGAGEAQIGLPMPVLRTQVFMGKSSYPSCGFLHGSIGELIVYNRAVTDSELLQIEQHLRDKWQCCTP